MFLDVKFPVLWEELVKFQSLLHVESSNQGVSMIQDNSSWTKQSYSCGWTSPSSWEFIEKNAGSFEQLR